MRFSVVPRLASRIPRCGLRRDGTEPQLGEQRVRCGQQLRHTGEIRVLFRRARVIGIQLARLERRALHERHALALHRVRDDRFRQIRALRPARGTSVRSPRRRGRRIATHVPAERAKLGLEVAKRTDLSDPRVRLDLVVIDDRDDLAQLTRRGRRRAIPRTALPAAPRRP